MRITSDGFEWLDQELGSGVSGFSLTMVKGMKHGELAVRLGAQPGTLMGPDVAQDMLELSGSSWDLPDYAMLGETVDGWAFAIESPGATGRPDRLASGRVMWSGHTVVHVSDTTMDPPVITVNVDGKLDWMFWEYSTDHTDHPLTRRLAAEADSDGGSPRMSDVYRIMGDHYGLSLPRQAVVDRRLPHVFTEPRVLVRPLARCPVCSEQMLPCGGGSWGPGEYRLVCVYYNVRDVPGRPPQGCTGEISGPALAGAVREEPNKKYANVCMPDQ
jgi:hypothetical protein